ncbi:MAG: hypothetical protein ACRDHP_18925, partial [Ktedonobacterales bacterium]
RMVPYEYSPPGASEPLTAQRFYAFYTPEEARTLVEGAGLAVVDVRTADDPRADTEAGWVSVLARKG